jgi:hypothetical protein
MRDLIMTVNLWSLLHIAVRTLGYRVFNDVLSDVRFGGFKVSERMRQNER